MTQIREQKWVNPIRLLSFSTMGRWKIHSTGQPFVSILDSILVTSCSECGHLWEYKHFHQSKSSNLYRSSYKRVDGGENTENPIEGCNPYVRLHTVAPYTYNGKRQAQSQRYSREQAKPERVFTNPSTRGAWTAVAFAWKGRFSGREFYI